MQCEVPVELLDHDSDNATIPEGGNTAELSFPDRVGSPSDAVIDWSGRRGKHQRIRLVHTFEMVQRVPQTARLAAGRRRDEGPKGVGSQKSVQQYLMAKKKVPKKGLTKPNNSAKYASMLAIINKHVVYLGYSQINSEYITMHLRKCIGTFHNNSTYIDQNA